MMRDSKTRKGLVLASGLVFSTVLSEASSGLYPDSKGAVRAEAAFFTRLGEGAQGAKDQARAAEQFRRVSSVYEGIERLASDCAARKSCDRFLQTAQVGNPLRDLIAYRLDGSARMRPLGPVARAVEAARSLPVPFGPGSEPASALEEARRSLVYLQGLARIVPGRTSEEASAGGFLAVRAEDLIRDIDEALVQ